MKKILGIVMMFSLMGLLSVMAQDVKPGKTEVVDLGKGIKLEMVLIPAGKFKMGSLETEKNRGCLLYTSPSPRDRQKSRMPSSA